MSAADLISDLRERGIVLAARGNRLRYWPASSIPTAVVETLRARKQEVLAELRDLRQRLGSDAPLPEATGAPAAVLIDSPTFGEVWLALAPDVAEVLRGEERRRGAPRPVLLPEDIQRLRGRSEAAIRACLNVVSVFPGAEIGDG